MNFAKEARTVSQFTFAIAVFFVGMMMFASSASADLDILGVEVEGDSTVTVEPEATIEVAVEVSRDPLDRPDGVSLPIPTPAWDDWKSTSYMVELNEVFTCVNTGNHTSPDYSSGGSDDTETFTITAPEEPGIYDLSVRVFRGEDCTGQDGGTQVLTDAIVVEIPPSSITVRKVTDTAEVGNDTQFTFTRNYGEPFSVLGDGENSEYVGELAPGTYTISETVPTNWTFDEVSCTGATEVDTEGTGVSLVVEGGEDVVCTFSNSYTPPPATGTLVITKYACPEGTPVTRSQNGVGEGAVAPEACSLQAGATFGYVYGEQTDANAPYPELEGEVTEAGATNEIGVLSLSLPASGRYLIVETDGNGGRLPHDAIINLYCEGDGDTSDTSHDNQELTFIPNQGTVQCVAYNIAVPTYTIDGYKWNDVDGDGSWDEGEYGIEGWTIQLTNGEETLETTTDRNGAYSFTVEAGSYTVREVSRDGWRQTAPEDYTCSFTFGGEERVMLLRTDDSCNFGNTEIIQCLDIESADMLSNSGFETPNIEVQWTLVDQNESPFAWIVKKVSDATDALLEFHTNYFGGPSEGEQHVELDGDESTSISQEVVTVPGNEYEIAFDFAPRPGTNGENNEIDVLADGVVIGTVTADGSDDTTAQWTSHDFSFTATDASTLIEFRDMGVSDGLGTLLDNTNVCLTVDHSIETFLVFGYAWEDEDSDAVEDEGENNAQGLTIIATDGDRTYTTTTDVNGYYEFNLPAGTWTIVENTEDWDSTFPVNETFSYEVVLPAVPFVSDVTAAPSSHIFAMVKEFLIPTALAESGYGPYNFGSTFVGGNGGSSSGSKAKSTNSTPDGEVLGASTSNPEGGVAGASTAMPAGAPNTGAGGTSPVVVVLPSLLAVLESKTSVRKSN